MMVTSNYFWKPLMAAAVALLLTGAITCAPQAVSAFALALNRHEQSKSSKPLSTSTTRQFLQAGDNGEGSQENSHTAERRSSLAMGREERFAALHQTLLEARRDMESKISSSPKSNRAVAPSPIASKDEKTSVDSSVNPQAVWIGSESAIQAATAPYDKAIREAERLTEEALRNFDQDQAVEEDERELPQDAHSAQDDMQQVPTLQADTKSISFQRSLLKTRLDMESRAKKQSVSAPAAAADTDSTTITESDESTFVKSQAMDDEMDSSASAEFTMISDCPRDDAQEVESFQEKSDYFSPQDVPVQELPTSPCPTMKDVEHVEASEMIPLSSGGVGEDIPATAFLNSPVVDSSTTATLDDVDRSTNSHTKRSAASTSDITSRIIYTLTPEQGVGHLRGQHDFDIIESVLVHGTKATMRGGKAAAFALGAVLEAVTSHEVANASKGAVTSLSAAVRFISDGVADEINQEVIAISHCSESDSDQKPSDKDGDLLFETAASCGALIQHVGGMAGAFLSRFSRTPLVIDAFVAATESTKECVSLLASTVALGIKQGERLKTLQVKLHRVMPSEEDASFFLSSAQTFGIQQGERAQQFAVRFWEDISNRNNEGASKNDESPDSLTFSVESVMTESEDNQDCVASQDSANADISVMEATAQMKTEICQDESLEIAIESTTDIVDDVKMSNLETQDDSGFFFAKWD